MIRYEAIALHYGIDGQDIGILGTIAPRKTEDGRYYVEWKTQSKVGDSFSLAMKHLQEHLAKESTSEL